MNILLDTHIALWAITDNPKLTQQGRELISAPKNNIWVSVVSIWEIAIKHTLGRGDMPVSSADAVRYFQASGYRMLSVEVDHVVTVETLALHHHDPFDRLLVAQALAEPMRLITHDRMVALYSDTIILV